MGIRDIIGKDTWIRTTYRYLKRYYYQRRNDSFLRKSLADVYHFNCTYDRPPTLLLITIAYNRADMVKHQLRLLPKYLSDPFRHIVVDNSRDKSARVEIATACRKHKVGYVSLPYNFYIHPSNSHGLALNWTYQHLAKALAPRYIGFLDHDIFPVREHSILKLLESQPFFGKKEAREGKQYLWPGFFFCQPILLEDIPVDFKPGAIDGVLVDTGGLIPIDTLQKGNYSPNFVDNRLVDVGGIISYRRKTSFQEQIEWVLIEGVDTWLHCMGVGYQQNTDAKKEKLAQLLSEY